VENVLNTSERQGVSLFYPVIQWDKIEEKHPFLSNNDFGVSSILNMNISFVEKRLEPLPNYKLLRFAGKISIILNLLLDTEFRKNIQRIYLFGSYAYGEPNEGSDLDFGVIIDDNNSWVEVGTSMTANLWRDMIGPCDVLVFEAKQFEERINVLSIEKVIYEYGVIVYDRR
jgi:uncharacterized protein